MSSPDWQKQPARGLARPPPPLLISSRPLLISYRAAASGGPEGRKVKGLGRGAYQIEGDGTTGSLQRKMDENKCRAFG